MESQKELTPELAQKIWNSVRMKMLGDRLAKDGTLHNLKQLKAQIGKLRKQYTGFGVVQSALDEVMSMIDKKIEKIKSIN